jgi:hypothetical protein
MTAYRKFFIVFYCLLVVVAVAITVAGGQSNGIISEGTATRVLTVLSVALIPVIIAAINTKDFWKEDPDDVSRLKREHRAEIAYLQALHLKKEEEIKATHQKANDEITIQLLDWKRKALKTGPQQVPRDDFGNPMR